MRGTRGCALFALFRLAELPPLLLRAEAPPPPLPRPRPRPRVGVDGAAATAAAGLVPKALKGLHNVEDSSRERKIYE